MATSRTGDLAAPRYHTQFRPDYRSVYWKIDYWPMQKMKPTKAVLTPRQAELARHRPVHNNYSAPRDDPEWKVEESAKQFVPTPRLEDLSRPKGLSQSFTFARPVQSSVSETAQIAECSQRIRDLCRPKRRLSLPTIESTQWNWSDVETVTPAALRGNATARVEQLAAHKVLPNQFELGRAVQSEVTPGALAGEATFRLGQLAIPKSRVDLNAGYDPYRVTKGALRCLVTQRVRELAEPLPRKQREKKVV